MRPAFWLIIVLGTAAIVAKSWMRWMDPLVDFGWQMYLPWRLSLGEHLGRDYVHAYGALSPYLNATWFRWFGVSVQTLVVANLVIYAIIVVLLHRLLQAAFGFAGAAAGTLVGILVFGFGHHSLVSNYTYAAPYTHEATHGVALLLVLLVLVTRRGEVPQWWPWLVGFVLGLICLTKVEVVFAGAAVALAGALLRWQHAASGRDPIRFLAAIGAGALVVLSLAWAWLALATDALTALRVVSSGFLGPVLYPAYTADPFSMAIMGLDQPLGNLKRVVKVGAIAFAYVSVLTFALRPLATHPLSGIRRGILLLLTVGAVAAAAFVLPRQVLLAGRALPLLMVVAGVGVGLHARRELRERRTLSARTSCQVLVWVAAMGLMTRVILAPRIYHYGFYLTMLAGVWLTAFLVAEWPRLTLPRSPWRRLLGVQLAAIIALIAACLLQDSWRYYSVRTESLGIGNDRMRGFKPAFSPAHSAIESARRYLEQTTPADATLLVIPEGIMLNYWTRRKHPLRIGELLPPTLQLNGRPVLQDLQKSPPDYIVLISRVAADEYQPFGSNGDVDRDALRWIQAEYRAVAEAGVDPLLPYNGRDFGFRILRKNTFQRVSRAPLSSP